MDLSTIREDIKEETFEPSGAPVPLALIANPSASSPLVDVSIIVHSGAAMDPEGKKGLAALTAAGLCLAFLRVSSAPGDSIASRGLRLIGMTEVRALVAALSLPMALAGLAAEIDLGTIEVPAVFSWLARTGGVAPEVMGIGPIAAVPKALQYAGMELSDIDLIELNEAFAAQYIGCERELGLDRRITNVNGSGIGLGHPVGATGVTVPLPPVDEPTLHSTSVGLVWMVAHDDGSVSVLPGTIDQPSTCPDFIAPMIAPWLARLRQIASPMPRVPPVMNATRPFSLSPTRIFTFSSAVISRTPIISPLSV